VPDVPLFYFIKKNDTQLVLTILVWKPKITNNQNSSKFVFFIAQQTLFNCSSILGTTPPPTPTHTLAPHKLHSNINVPPPTANLPAHSSLQSPQLNVWRSSRNVSAIPVRQLVGSALTVMWVRSTALNNKKGGTGLCICAPFAWVTLTLEVISARRERCYEHDIIYNHRNLTIVCFKNLYSHYEKSWNFTPQFVTFLTFEQWTTRTRDQ